MFVASVEVSESGQKSSRTSLHVNLSPDAKEIIDGIRRDTGVSQVVVMERLLQWFTSVDRRFRLAIINRDSETQRELAADALARMAGAGNVTEILKAASSLDLDEAHQAMLALTNRMFAEAKALRLAEEQRKKRGV